MISSVCLSCALLNRLKTCKGKKLRSDKSSACPKFIDNRAGCRRCSYVTACKSLGKKIGIYHLCGNFEKAVAPLLEPKDFPDYKLYLEKQAQKENNKKNITKSGKKKSGNKDKSKLVSSRKIPLIKTKLSKEDVHKEKLIAMDNALLSSLDSNSAMLNAIMENGNADRADDWSPEGVIEKIVSSNYDPRVFSLINDGDIVKPDNPVRFMIEPNFMNVSLFPRQLQIALLYFSAYCPHCSNHKFIKDEIQVNTPIDEILDRTVFYSNGVCPKCGSTRYEAIQQGLHGNYSTFIGLCGQRCVTGDTLILTSDGLTEIGDIAKKHDVSITGFQNYNVKCPAVSLEDGLLVNPSKFYISEVDTVYKIYFGNGMELNCTADHPIMTQRGFVKTKDLVVNEDLVPIYINQQVWGSSPLDFTSLNQEIKDNYCISIPISTVDEELARFLGILASKEYLSRIDCSRDTAVFCDIQMKRLYNEAAVTVPWVRYHLNGLLGGGAYKIDANDNMVIIEEEQKFIPKHIMTSPKDIVCAFLQGLFDVNGYIEDSHIELKSSSHKLLQQVSALLHNLGILCVIRGFDNYRILKILDKESLLKFQKNINFFSALKKVELYNAIDNNSTHFKEDGENFYYCKVRRIDKLRKKQVTYDFTVPSFHRFVSNTVVSSNSGKSVFHGIVASTVLAQYLSLPNPITFMKQLESVTFRMSFVGLRYQDAFENLWQDIFNNLSNAPWYKNYFQFLDEEGIRLGRELYKLKDSFAMFSVKGIGLSPSGPDKRYLRGRCLHKDMLVNTSQGFIKVKDLVKRDDLGKVYVGGKYHDIMAVQKQLKKKECLKITLKNGQSIKVTTDHRIPVYSAETNSLVLKEAQELSIGDYLVTQLGGDFPKEYKFDFTFSYRPSYIRAAEWISDGHIFTIFELADALGMSVQGARQHALGEMFKAGVINKYRQRDEHGWELPCLYQINEKFRLEDWNKLREGVINNRGKSHFALPDKMTPELGRLIGYLLSDGSVSGRYVIDYSTTSPEKRRDFIDCCISVFGVTPNTRLDKRLMYGPNRDLPGYHVELAIKPILNFFEYIGLRYKKAATKIIPDCIMQAPRDCVLECISAMISSDGGISRTSYKGRFYYASDSKKLIRQLQQLMLKLGYYCRIARKGENLVLNTLESINFYEEYTGLNKRTWRDDFDLGKNAPYAFREYRIPGTNSYTRSYVNDELDVAVNKKYSKWIDKDIVFTPITDIKNIGRKTVYDVEIDSKNHLFPANNILVHNTRIFSSIDEISHFFGKEGSVKLDPDEVSLALDNSLYTVRAASAKLISKYPDVPNAHSFNISSPRSKLDKGMRLYKQAKHIPSFFFVRMPTWEFNPNITREDLNDRFLSDPVGAERDFGANPPFGDDLYIPNAADILGMITRKRNALEIVKYKTAADSLGGKTLYPLIKTHPNNAPCVLACDAGAVKNSFALALMYKKRIEIEDVEEEELDEIDNNMEDEEGSEEQYQEITVCAGLLEITPKDGLPLNFPLIYEFVIKKIIEDFNVQLVAFDRWQSISLRQSVYQDFGIDAVQYSVNMQDFNNLKEDVLSENFTVPKLEQDIQDIISLEKDLDVLVHGKPVSHLLVQMLTSKDNGRVITKGDETSDDLLRAVCLGHSLLFDENYSELFDDYDGDDEDEESEGPRTDPSMIVGVGVGGSGNTFGGSSGGVSGGGTGGITSIPGIGVSVSLG